MTYIQILGLTKKAFQLRKVKIDTLKYAFEQIKPILRKYMKKNQILELELDLKTKHVLTFEPIQRCEREFWVIQWLDNELSTKKFIEKMKERYQWVQYLSFTDFLSDVETWVKEMK